MEDLILTASSETPAINFQGNTGTFSFEGKSFPENVNEFYKPIQEYLLKYAQEPNSTTAVSFRWLYYNTATFKMIVNILLIFKEMKTSLSVNWICAKDNELMIEKGEELKEVIDLNMEISVV